MTCKISPLSDGNNPLYWDTVQSLIGEADIPIEPEMDYRPSSETVRTMSGSDYERGYPAATWRFTGLDALQRYTLRQICRGASADVYIETTTNEFDMYGERVWTQAQAIMHWPPGEEKLEADRTIDLSIEFTHLIEV